MVGRKRGRGVKGRREKEGGYVKGKRRRLMRRGCVRDRERGRREVRERWWICRGKRVGHRRRGKGGIGESERVRSETERGRVPRWKKRGKDG